MYTADVSIERSSPALCEGIITILELTSTLSVYPFNNGLLTCNYVRNS